jgi:beta-lactamase regulating signal transducer with metallopeptidase domain
MESLLNVGISNAVAAVVLALVAFAVDRVFRRPALSHLFWLLVLLKLLTPPLVHVPLPWPSGPARPAVTLPQGVPAVEDSVDSTPPSPAGVLAADQPPPAINDVAPAPVSWTPYVLGAWLAGSCAWWILAAIRIARFGRLLRQAAKAPTEVCERVRRLADLLGLRRAPAVAFVPGPVSPLLWAPGRSAHLLLPKALWEHLDDDQRDSLLVHELAHLRRGDHRARRLELLALGLYWWHPIAWWARHELQEAEERCCDGWVARVLPGSAAAYASALVETVAFLSAVRPAVPFGASGGGRARHLKRRVTMILEGKTARPLGRLTLRFVLCIGAGALMLAPGSAEPPQAAEAQTAAGQRDLQRRPTPAVAVHFSKTRTLAPDNPPRADANQLIAAQEEVELLEVQLAVGQAQLDVAKAAADGAKPALARAEAMFKRNAIGVEELERARLQVRSHEMDLAVLAAQMREPEVRLKHARRRVAALQGDPSGDKKDAKPDESRRLNDMQKKVDDLHRDIETFRQELSTSQSGFFSLAGDGSTLFSRQRVFQLPYQVSPERRGQVKEIVLLVSEDGGKTSKEIGRATETTGKFPFVAPRDGRYLLSVCTVDRDGKQSSAPSLVVVVDTKKPAVSLTTWTEGDEHAVEWAIDEPNPDLTTFQLECRIDGKWKKIPVEAAMKGRRLFSDRATAVRLLMKDLAGNEVVALQDPLP